MQVIGNASIILNPTQLFRSRKRPVGRPHSGTHNARGRVGMIRVTKRRRDGSTAAGSALGRVGRLQGVGGRRFSVRDRISPARRPVPRQTGWRNWHSCSTGWRRHRVVGERRMGVRGFCPDRRVKRTKSPCRRAGTQPSNLLGNSVPISIWIRTPSTTPACGACSRAGAPPSVGLTR